MLKVEDLPAYYGKSHILQGVDLAVGANEIVSILRRNGVGRSTTLKAIMGDPMPRGEIVFTSARSRAQAAPDRAPRHRLRAGRARHLPKPDGGAKPSCLEASRSARPHNGASRARGASFRNCRARQCAGRRAIGREQ